MLRRWLARLRRLFEVDEEKLSQDMAETKAEIEELQNPANRPSRGSEPAFHLAARFTSIALIRRGQCQWFESLRLPLWALHTKVSMR